MRTLTNRVAVVTGAGSGIGRALALELANRGCHLALTDLEEGSLVPVLSEIEGLGRTASMHAFDVADREAWPGVVEDILAVHGSVQLLVNNAGVSLLGPFTNTPLDDIAWQIDVNLWGVVHGCHFFLPHLLEQEEAHIVNLSSIFGIVSVPDNAAYCMSKHAVRSLTESLELELWDTPVRMTSVHPGAVATGIVRGGRWRHVEGGFTSKRKAERMIDKGMPPADAARIVANGIQADKRRILVGRDARFLARLQQLMPTKYRDVARMWLSWQRRR